MKNILYLFLIFVSLTVFGQVPLNDENRKFMESYTETPVAFTDRNLYLSGENIWFTTILLTNSAYQSNTVSKVLYVEIFDKATRAIAQGKFEIVKNICSGNMTIPAETLSGAYFIRFYTKYQQNQKLENQALIPLTIVNPEMTLPSTEAANTTVKPLEEKYAVSVNSVKDEYTKRERVLLEINLPNDFQGFLSVSAVLKNTIQHNIEPVSPEPGFSNDYFYVPDIRGISLSGFVRDKTTLKPIENAEVYLSAFGNQRIFQMNETFENGTFLFALKNPTGIADVFVSIDPTHYPNSEIKINNGFSNFFGILPNHPFFLDTTYRRLLTKMLINHQSQQVFEMQQFTASENATLKNFPSSVDFSVSPDDYISLSTIEEIIYEIVHPVSVKSNEGKKYLAVANHETQQRSSADLVLLDNVPVFNIDELLKISPSLIRTIDVIQRPYYIGDYLLSGVVSFKTKTDDFGGHKFPGQSTFLEYHTYNNNLSVSLPDYSKMENFQSPLPDFRTTLFWMPFTETSNSQIEVAFFTSDVSGIYDIRVIAVSTAGDIFWGNGEITVQ